MKWVFRRLGGLVIGLALLRCSDGSEPIGAGGVSSNGDGGTASDGTGGQPDGGGGSDGSSGGSEGGGGDGGSEGGGGDGASSSGGSTATGNVSDLPSNQVPGSNKLTVFTDDVTTEFEMPNEFSNLQFWDFEVEGSGFIGAMFQPMQKKILLSAPANSPNQHMSDVSLDPNDYADGKYQPEIDGYTASFTIVVSKANHGWPAGEYQIEVTLDSANTDNDPAIDYFGYWGVWRVISAPEPGFVETTGLAQWNNYG